MNVKVHTQLLSFKSKSLIKENACCKPLIMNKMQQCVMSITQCIRLWLKFFSPSAVLTFKIYIRGSISMKNITLFLYSHIQTFTLRDFTSFIIPERNITRHIFPLIISPIISFTLFIYHLFACNFSRVIFLRLCTCYLRPIHRKQKYLSLHGSE